MASPAPAQNGGTIDPHRKAQYTLQITDTILDRDIHESSYSSVRINHKPNQNGASRKTKLRTTGRSTAVLDINDRQDSETSTYHYEGTKSSPKKSYVLVFDQDSQTARLEPLTSSYSLNLKSTPEISSSKRLAEIYPQIREQSDLPIDGDSSDPSGSMSDGEPDPDNPFDFRHFLDGAKQPRLSPSPAPVSIPKASVTESSSTKDRASVNVDTKTSQRSVQQRPTPRIRVERKASTRSDDHTNDAPKKISKPVTKTKQDVPVAKSRAEPTSMPRSQEPAKSQEFDLLDNDDEDDEDDFMGSSGAGGLEIDFGDEGPPPRSRARTLTLAGASRSGPISLRSAANSPSSQINTPQQRLQDVDEVEFDFGGPMDGYEDEDADISDEDEASPPSFKSSRAVREVVESDGDDDVDVEPMSLGSPVVHHAADSADEMDHDADLAEGVWAGLAESGHISTAQESESESEAE